jgi:hypothetical protein
MSRSPLSSSAPCPKRPEPAPVSRRHNAPAAGRGLAGSAWDDRASMRAELLSTVGQGVQGCVSGSSAAEDKKYFSPTLKFSIMSGGSPESRKALGHLNQRKNAVLHENANRNVGGDDRGMSLNLKISAGLIAQNEEVNAQ